MRTVSGARGVSCDENNDGFTLVELLIALFIIGLTFAALLSVVLASFGAIRNNEARVRATALSNELIEELVATPWGSLGLYENEAPATTFTVDGEEEDVVLFPEPEAPEDRDDQVPFPVQEGADAIDRDGRSYDVQRWITWVEDEDTGNNQALKRLVVIVSWELGGTPRTMRMESLRAPLPGEMLDLTVEFTEVVNQDAPSNLNEIPLELDDPNDETTWENADTISAWIRVGDVAASVEISWIDRQGFEQSIGVEETGEGDTERQFLIPEGYSTFNHGPTSLVVTAVGGDGQIATNTAPVHFYQPLVVHTPVVESHPVGGVIEVCDGVPVEDIVIDVDVEGMTGTGAFADGVTLQWGTDTDRPDPALGVLSVTRHSWGGEFQFVIDEDVATAWPFEDGEQVTFTVTADRVSTSGNFDAAESAPTASSFPVEDVCTA